MSKTVSFRGAKIAYKEKGKGRAVVLIHGFLGSKEVWKDHFSRLSKHFRVIAIDMPGHGASDCIGYLHSMELMAEAVSAVLKACNIRKVVLVGHSMGAYVALAFAELFPDAVLGLLMINSTAKGDSPQRKQSREQLIELVKKDRKRAVDLLIPTFFNLRKRNTHWKIKAYRTLAEYCSERGILASIEGIKNRKEREIILKFAPFPYAIIAGEADTLLPEASLMQQARLGEKGYYVLLEDSGHMSLLDEVERVYGVIKTFASKLKLAKRSE
jgi:pimeloyl-ACP methyl ester carboxylesterase